MIADGCEMPGMKATDRPRLVSLLLILIAGTSRMSFGQGAPVSPAIDPWLNVAVADVTAAKAQEAGLPTPRGSYVVVSGPGSIAEAAGLRTGDIVLEIEGGPVEGGPVVLFYLETKRPGDPVNLTIWRDGRTQTLHRAMGSPGFVAAAAEPAGGWLGISVGDVSLTESFQAGTAQPGGARIHWVVPGGPAEAAGLQIGDLVVALDGRPVLSAGAMVQSVAAKRPGEPMTVSVLRNRQSLQLQASLGQVPNGDAAQFMNDVVQGPLDDACARFLCPACIGINVQLDVPATRECRHCVTGFAAAIADCRSRGGTPSAGPTAVVAGADPPEIVVPPASPALELNALRAVPERVGAGGRFAVELTFTARNASGASGRLPVSLSYSIEQGGHTLFDRAPETIEVPNGQPWRVVKNLAASRTTGQYTIRVRLAAGVDTVQGETTLVVD